LLDAEAKQAKLDRDVVLRFTDRSFDAGVARFSSALHDDQRTMMLRYRPELPSKSQRQRRDWVFLFESSGDREPVLARVQVDVIKTLLNNAEHDDTFAILTAGTQVRAFANELMPATPENVKKAVEFLDGVHLVGALDLGQGLAATEPFVKSGKDAYIVHVGSGMPVLGERAEDKLLQRIPNGARYIGVGVGKRWSRQFMKTAASRTGGYFTQINPDEPVAWRAFDLYSTLNTPRLLGISVADQAERATFLCYDDSIAHGEELCAIARLAAADPFPQKIIVSGTLDGEPFRREIAVDRIADKADYIPRTWAKLRIDQLLAEDPARHKDEIISLSKAMYVMSPFTSLLVLENEQMYVQFNVDRGRKDHWAMYDCPPEIPVVYEPERSKPDETRKSVQVTNESGKPRSLPDIFLVRIPPQFITHPAGTSYYSLGQTYMSLVVSPDDESISANQARWGANRRLALRPSLQRYWFRHPSAEAEQNLPGLGVYFRALPNNGTWSSEIDVHGDFEFPDTLEKLITGRNEFSASFDGRYLWDTYGKDTGWNVPLHSWVVDVSPWMEREEIAEQWKNTDRFSLPVGKLLPSLGLPAFDGAGVDGYRLGRLFVDLGVPLQQGVEGRRFDPHFAFLPMDGQVPSNIGALDVKGLEDLGVVILRGIPQDVEGMKNIISEVQKISGGVNGGWLSYKARVEQQLQLQRELREQKESRSLESLRAVDESALPFDKSFMSIRYPDAKSWEDLADSVIRNKLRVYPGDLLDTSSLRRSEANLRKSRLFFESNGGRPMQDGVSLWVSMGEITGATPFVGSNWANPDAGFASFHMPDNFRRGLAAPYERPSFSGETRVFSDFVSFAPGMLTSQVDVLGLLEAEIASDVKRDRGNIDPAALALIERARETAWQTITFPSQTGREHRELTVDGAGRFLSEATTTVGLREQVICDGTTLWHLYPELGVGTRRSISRFHRAGLRSLVPWLLPPAEELARGANLRLAADRTVAIVPRWAEGAKDADGNPMQYVCLHLVFAEDGRLVERRLLKMPSSEVLARETYDADGTVRLIGADDKVLAEVKRPIEPATNEPNLVPDTNLVLLPIPARTRDHIIESTGRQHYGNFGEWSEEDALKLLAADLSQDPVQLMQIIGQRFFAKGDHRIGFYTLLMSSGLTWDPQSEQAMNNGTHVRFDPVVDHPDSMLAKYVFLHEQQMTKSGKIEEMDLATQHPSPPGGEGSLSHNAFVQQLAEFRDLYVRSIKATNLLSNDPSHEANRQKAIDFVQRAQSPLFGWAVLTLFKDRDATPEAHRAWAAASMRFERVLGLSYAARYEAARSYVRAGDWQKARELFSDLYTRTLKRGILPPIDEAFNQAFQNGGDNGLNHQERKVFRDAAMFLMDKKARSAIIAIAWQCHHVGDRQIADELFAMACAGLGDTERIETTLTGVAYLAQTEQYTRAEALLQPLLDDDQLSQIPVLWRLGAALAEKNGMTARSVACLDRAMDIEYEHLPEEVNLEAVRAEFGKLLTRYQQLADSIASLRLEPSQDIMNRVVRAADRWRSLDPDDTTACQAAARVLDRLGAREAAWEYVTTPFGDKPGEPPTWLSLGQEMREQACIELADRAYQNAFIAEPTNAQILWERAQMLEQTGKSDVARQCYRQIADGQWDSQFQSIQTQARKAINE
jgi:predicted Zn-dependent protease